MAAWPKPSDRATREEQTSIGVAIVSADPRHWEELSSLVAGCGLHPIHCATPAALTQTVWEEPFELAICDDELPDGNYRQLIDTPCWPAPSIAWPYRGAEMSWSVPSLQHLQKASMSQRLHERWLQDGLIIQHAVDWHCKCDRTKQDKVV